MAKKRSFRQQLFNAIDSRFKVGQGRQKHQDKKNKTNLNHDIIYCSNEHKDLKSFISSMDDWIKENHPELHRSPISEFPVEVAEEYLKTKTDCSQKTIDSYRGRIQKAFRCAGAVYKSADFSFMNYLRAPLSDRSEEATLRDIAIGRNLLDKALVNMQKDSGGYRGNKIASMFATRIHEVVTIEVRDVDFQKNTLTIVHGKGKKKRVLPMNAKQKAVMWEMCKDKKPNQRIVGCGEDAVQKALLRALGRIDNKEGTNFEATLKDKKTNTHAIRKLVATERYNENLFKEYYKHIEIKIKDEILSQQAGNPSSIANIDMKNFNDSNIKAFMRKNWNQLAKLLVSKDERRQLEYDAWSEVSVYLGHGPGRWELKEVYVISEKTNIIDLPNTK